MAITKSWHYTSKEVIGEAETAPTITLPLEKLQGDPLQKQIQTETSNLTTEEQSSSSRNSEQPNLLNQDNSLQTENVSNIEPATDDLEKQLDEAKGNDSETENVYTFDSEEQGQKSNQDENLSLVDLGANGFQTNNNLINRKEGVEQDFAGSSASNLKGTVLLNQESLVQNDNQRSLASLRAGGPVTTKVYFAVFLENQIVLALKLKDLGLKNLIADADEIKEYDVLKLHTKSDAIRLNIFVQYKATFTIQGTGSSTKPASYRDIAFTTPVVGGDLQSVEKHLRSLDVISYDALKLKYLKASVRVLRSKKTAF